MCSVFCSGLSGPAFEFWQVPVVGSDCTPWSSQGSRSGFLHEAIPRFWVVLSKLLSGNYNMFCLENSGTGFPTENIRAIIHAEGFGSNVAVVCPTQLGFPAVRHRTLMTCFDMTKFVSVIPFPLNHQQETWERAFLHQTSKHFEKDDRAFVNDSPEHDLDAIQSRARRRGIFNCESTLSLTEQMVPGHMRSRYERYVAASNEKTQFQVSLSTCPKVVIRGTQ